MQPRLHSAGRDPEVDLKLGLKQRGVMQLGLKQRGAVRFKAVWCNAVRVKAVWCTKMYGNAGKKMDS